ncbi:hypothetical protein CCH79_00018801, partial [Gambusia affinis]
SSSSTAHHETSLCPTYSTETRWSEAAGDARSSSSPTSATPSSTSTHDGSSISATGGRCTHSAPVSCSPGQNSDTCLLSAAAAAVGEMVAAPMVPTPPRPVNQSLVKPTPSIIQAAPTVYTAPPAAVVQRKAEVQAQRQARMVWIPPDHCGLAASVSLDSNQMCEELAARVAKQQAAVMAAGLLDRKDSDESSSVIGPSMPEPEVPHTEVMPVENVTEDKKKGKNEKVKKCIRIAAGSTWEDPSLLEWESDDFRIFCGDLGNEVNDDILARAFSRYPSFLKAKVVRDKRTGKTKGYGFVSFKDPNDYVRAMREMNGKYVGSRPIKLRKSMWKDRNIEVVRKKQKEKKKLGLR